MFEPSPFDVMPVLETESLILRKMEMRDAPDMYEYSRDPLVAKHVLWDAHTSISDTKSYIRYMLRKYRQGEPSSWCIEEKSTGKVVGTIGYMWHQADNSACEVGYSLAHDCWNKGYTTEITQGMIDFIREKYDPELITAECAVENIGSARVMEKCGMTFVGFGEYSSFDGSRTYRSKKYELRR